MEHLSLGRPIEASIGPGINAQCAGWNSGPFRPLDRWQEWYKTEDGRRHYKHSCNIMRDALVMFRRMFGQDW